VTGLRRPNDQSRLRLQDLMGRTVVDGTGRHLGRVVDLWAEPGGGELHVVGLLVGPSAWRARFGPRPSDLGHLIHWKDLASLEPRIIVRDSERRE
jgi:sporulation protein YlmC with PRC-barrel domain